jgi:hypothetical protein
MWFMPSYRIFLMPNVVVERLTLLLRIREVQGSKLGLETCFPGERFRGFPQSLQANDGIY